MGRTLGRIVLRGSAVGRFRRVWGGKAALLPVLSESRRQTSLAGRQQKTGANFAPACRSGVCCVRRVRLVLRTSARQPTSGQAGRVVIIAVVVMEMVAVGFIAGAVLVVVVTLHTNSFLCRTIPPAYHRRKRSIQRPPRAGHTRAARRSRTSASIPSVAISTTTIVGSSSSVARRRSARSATAGVRAGWRRTRSRSWRA